MVYPGRFALPEEACPKALAAAERALELDEGLGSAHISLAWHKMIYNWDWTGAETEFKRGLELSPDYATGHDWYALFLTSVDRDDEALAHMNRALELDPLSLPIQMAAGVMHSKVSDFEQSEKIFRKALEMDPEFWPFICIEPSPWVSMADLKSRFVLAGRQ